MLATSAYVRWMIRPDMKSVLDIDSLAYPSPWEQEEYLRRLRVRNCIGMVAEIDSRVVGAMLYELHDHKLTIERFAVHPDHQRQGIGSQMAAKLKSKITVHRRRRIVVDVRDDNLTAQLFFRSCGFKAKGILRDRYDDGCDEYRMVYAKEE